ncbi:MAG: histidine--tRNA ligase [Deltaproteobacteria bacterium]|jgi:histidyl-tRNA synthetase|nr:histidine--tRNA ligase [Deltaproteobacteria bacterium]
MTSITALRGFKDILPKEIPPWIRLEEKARDLARRYGYQEIRPPVLERTSLFARGIGEATDIVEKEMYTLSERGGDLITLRPEATAGVTRAVIEHNLLESGKAVKLFSIGPMFRYERPQKGRFRQFHQLDVEVYGDPGPYVDAEVIAFLWDFLTELGLKDLTVDVNSLGCEDCRKIFRENFVAYFQGQEQDLCPDCQRRLSRNPLRLFDCKNSQCQELLQGAPKISEYLCNPCQEHFASVKETLHYLNLTLTVNPFLVRGLDYYTRTAFEVKSGSLGAQNAVAGGGRYDGLVKNLGGPDAPGIGFAVGLERLAMLLPESELSSFTPDAYLALLSQSAILHGFRLTQYLRTKGVSVMVDWEAGSLKSRLKRADKFKARKVLILGEDELLQKELLIRDLTTGEQKKLPLEDLENLANAI